MNDEFWDGCNNSAKTLSTILSNWVRTDAGNVMDDITDGGREYTGVTRQALK